VLVKSKVGEGEEVTYGGQTIPCSKTDMVCLVILATYCMLFVKVFQSILIYLAENRKCLFLINSVVKIR
jgi:hypothetical protein